MNKYAQLDHTILRNIRIGKRKFDLIHAAVADLAARFVVRGDGFRVTDRRLQSMRKRGLIVFEKKEWRIA